MTLNGNEQSAHLIARLLDEHNVTETLHRYADAVDRRMKADWLDCFTEAAEFVGAGKPAAITRGGQRIVGLQALAEFFDSRPSDAVRHVIGNIRVQLRGDVAVAHSAVVSYLVGSDAPQLRSVGDYEDELVRCEDGTWRFSRRCYQPAG